MNLPRLHRPFVPGLSGGWRDALRGPGPIAFGGTPEVHVRHGARGLEVTCALGPFDARDLDVKVRGRRLIVRGRREVDARHHWGGWTIASFSSAAFTRSIALPDDVNPDALEARVEGGRLQIRVPARPRGPLGWWERVMCKIKQFLPKSWRR